MRVTYITAIAIAIVILGWLLSGQINAPGDLRHPTLAEQNRQAQAQAQDKQPTRVRGRVISASLQSQHIVLRGKTQNKRTVQIRAETAGRIINRPVERGTSVQEGDVLCQISLEDRAVGVAEARAVLNQARIEYEGSNKLKLKGFQSATAIAQAQARLATAQAQLKRRELDIQRTFVRAPFAGVVEDVTLEIGDYVAPGAACVTIVDLDPMLLVGRVAEKDVHLVQLGQEVTGLLRDGSSIRGPVSFIGNRSDPATRTYAVEIQVANPKHLLRSGITTEIRIPIAEVMAQKITPALFALDDAGKIGVRTVNEEGFVEFHHVTIVREDADGVWVAGLPEFTTIITVGQELVVPGERVVVDFEPVIDMPASAPEPATSPNDETGNPNAGSGIELAAKS
jgi:multidrug efflux system membrane fusion protein